jgi:hypothetical protein
MIIIIIIIVMASASQSISFAMVMPRSFPILCILFFIFHFLLFSRYVFFIIYIDCFCILLDATHVNVFDVLVVSESIH